MNFSGSFQNRKSCPFICYKERWWGRGRWNPNLRLGHSKQARDSSWKLRTNLQGALDIPSTQLFLYLSLSCDGAGLFTYRHMPYSTHIYSQINSYHPSCKMVFQIYITDFYQEVSSSLALILRRIRKYSEKSMASSEQWEHLLLKVM